MAIVYMDRVIIPIYSDLIKNEIWEYDILLASPGNGDTIIIPGNVSNVAVTFGITAGSGKIQTTTTNIGDVVTDTNVVWVDWDSGVVTSTIQDALAAPVTAIRQVNVSGTTRLMLRCQGG